MTKIGEFFASKPAKTDQEAARQRMLAEVLMQRAVTPPQHQQQRAFPVVRFTRPHREP